MVRKSKGSPMSKYLFDSARRNRKQIAFLAREVGSTVDIDFPLIKSKIPALYAESAYSGSGEPITKRGELPPGKRFDSST